MRYAMLALALALASSAASAATTDDGDTKVDEAAKRYTPEIRGQLVDGAKVVSSNVCLRPDDSQIRMCGYTDLSGHFYIPPSGPMHSVLPKADDGGVEDYPKYWLEIGRVTEARKIATIELTNDKRASIVLECNLARSAGTAGASICDRKSAESATPGRVTQAEPSRRHTPAHPAR